MGGRGKLIYIAILAAIWGSSFILIKRGLVGLTPLQLGSLRLVCAAAFLLVIGFRTLPKIPLAKWKFIVLTALFGTFLPAFLFAIAQTQIGSTVSSILNALTPLNTLVIGVLLFSLDYKRNHILGVLIGLSGSALLILSDFSGHPGQNQWYALLVLIASMCYATNVNLVKKYLSDLSPLTVTTGNFAVLLVPALCILSFSGFFGKLGQAEVQHASLFIVVLGVIGTGVANILFYRLIQISSPVFAASVTYLIPVVAFFWGLLDGEVLTAWQVVGAAIVLLGVYLSSRK